jgi:hypothetical protein
MTEPLSPAARAVLYDAHNRWLDVDDDIPAQVAAAALRAAAYHCRSQRLTDRRWICVDELLLIAAELEGE